MGWGLKCAICGGKIKDGQNLYELTECHWYAGKRYIDGYSEDKHRYIHYSCIKEGDEK